MVNDLDVPVPRNREAEEAVVGACMQSKVALNDAMRVITGRDFFDPSNELIWDALLIAREAHDTIDPMLVMNELNQAGNLERAGGAARLADLIGNPLISTNVTYYAMMIRETARARRAVQIHQRIGQALRDNVGDHDQLLTRLAGEALQLDLLVDERALDAPIDGLMKWSELWGMYPNVKMEWLIPDLLLPEDVFLLLAGEGGGKSWFSRQFCLALAAGIHPFKPHLKIEPRRTLLVDLENAPAMVAHESRALSTQIVRLGQFDDDRAHVWMREDGLNLRERGDAALLERVVAETRPELVALGSLYKAFRKGDDSWDQAAEETRTVLDRIRRRYKCAFLIEHHMPKAAGGSSQRAENPYGSSEWMRWPSLGYTITRVGENMYEFNQFRGDRMRRDMPVGLVRGGELPWTPVMDPEEVEYGKWDELKRKPRRA